VVVLNIVCCGNVTELTGIPTHPHTHTYIQPPHLQGQYLSLDEWPIPADMVLVEFLGLPKKEPVCPQKFLVPTAYTAPFHADVHMRSGGGSPQKRKQQQSMLAFTTASTANSKADHDNKRKWNSNSHENMINFLGFHKSAPQAKLIEAHVMALARQYLADSLAYFDSMEAKASAEEAERARKRQLADEDAEHVVATSSDDDSVDFGKYAKQGLKHEKHVKIEPDTWLSYTHKVIKMLKYSRVVEVRPKSADIRVVVENGDILDHTYQVRVMQSNLDGSCDKDNGYSYKALREYKFKVGVSKTLKSLHERVSERSVNNKLDLGGAKRGRNAAQGTEISKLSDEEGSADEGAGTSADAGAGARVSISPQKRVSEQEQDPRAEGGGGASDKRKKVADASSHWSNLSESDDDSPSATFS